MPIALRTDFDAASVRLSARQSKEAGQVRRLLALAAIYDGANRTAAAEIGGVTLQIVRDWVVKFNAGGPEGLIDHKAPGQPSLLNDTHRVALAAIIESGPIPAVHGVVRWRIIDLRQWVWDEFRISVSKQTLSRELRAMGYRKLSARPRHHAQAQGAIEDFKKSFPPCWRPSRTALASKYRTQSSGSATKPELDRRTRPRGAGANVERAHLRQKTNALPPPTSSAPSAPRKGSRPV